MKSEPFNYSRENGGDLMVSHSATPPLYHKYLIAPLPTQFFSGLWRQEISNDVQHQHPCY